MENSWIRIFLENNEDRQSVRCDVMCTERLVSSVSGNPHSLLLLLYLQLTDRLIGSDYTEVWLEKKLFYMSKQLMTHCVASHDGSL